MHPHAECALTRPAFARAMMKKTLVLLTLAACAHSGAATSTETGTTETGTSETGTSESGTTETARTTTTQTARDDAVRLTPRPDLARVFTDAGFEGSFAAWTAGESEGVCVGDCETRVPPASTFKVPHALIALDLGVLDGPEHSMPWDGERRWVEAWNQDHTLATAIRDSALWYFQRVAPEIGEERMRTSLESFDYGNATIGDAIDAFWIDGSLRISPKEQVRWWHRLHEGDLPAGENARTEVLRMTELARDGDRVLRGKTGWDRREGEPNHGWLTGCVDGRERTCFATLIVASDPFDQSAFRRARHEISHTLLDAIGAPAPD